MECTTERPRNPLALRRITERFDVNIVMGTGFHVADLHPRIVAADNAEPVGTELLRYGYRVAVLALPAHPLLRTPEALAVVGPRAFGYDVDYVPLERDRG